MQVGDFSPLLVILILLMILCVAMIAGRIRIMSMSRNGKTTSRPFQMRRGSYTCAFKNQSTNFGSPALSGVAGL